MDPAQAAGDAIALWVHRSWCLQARAVSRWWQWEFASSYSNVPMWMGRFLAPRFGYLSSSEGESDECTSADYDTDPDFRRPDSDFGDTEVRRDVMRGLSRQEMDGEVLIEHEVVREVHYLDAAPFFVPGTGYVGLRERLGLTADETLTIRFGSFDTGPGTGVVRVRPFEPVD